MANTTFNGPVRSQNGFQDISVAAATGTVTTNSTYGNNATIGGNLTVAGAIISGVSPSLKGLSVTAKNTAGALTYVAGINVNNFTGAAAQVSTLPSATVGVIVVHAQSVDTTGGTATLTFNCGGTDAYETGSVMESRATNAVTFDTSTAGETNLVFTPASATTNLMSIGSYIYFTCTTEGLWNISYNLNSLGAGTTGAFAFAA
jgi:hypothetical protein|tara:strand:- start:1104 stop:1712 length:609 start_codon:yes stop_codon:yes gene_type:complete